MTNSLSTLANPVGKITGWPSRTSATVASGVLSRSSSSWSRDVLCFSPSRLTCVEGCVILIARPVQSGMPEPSATTTANRSAIAARLAEWITAAGTDGPSTPGSARVAVAAATTVGA